MKSQLHKFELKPRPGSEDSVSVGANMQLFIDGKPTKGVSRVTLDVGAKKVAKLKIEVLGNFNATAWALGDYGPVMVKTKTRRKP